MNWILVWFGKVLFGFGSLWLWVINLVWYSVYDVNQENQRLCGFRFRSLKIGVNKFIYLLNVRCVERLCGYRGLDVMDFLRRIVISPHWWSKMAWRTQEERAKCRSDIRKEWTVYMLRIITNHRDHLSFYFSSSMTPKF